MNSSDGLTIIMDACLLFSITKLNKLIIDKSVSMIEPKI